MATYATRGIGYDSDPEGRSVFVGKKYLLAIGIDEYDPVCGFSPLKYPAKDADQFVCLLKEEYGFEEPVAIYNENTTEKEIKRNIIDLKKNLKPEDQLVVFFAGHGAAVNNNGYWIAYDSEKDIELNLSVSVILELLIGCCSQVLLIVDCCFSGSATDKAYPLALFTGADYKKSKFLIITSGNKHETVPDKSIFMETLLDILKIKDISSFEGLLGDLKSGIASKNVSNVLTHFSSIDHEGGSFVLRRKDAVSYELSNSFFELNYSDQIPRIKGIRLLNIIYLKGTKESGHHIFTARFFKVTDKNSVTMFNYIPYIISFGRDSQSAEYSIWHYLGTIFTLPENDYSAIIKQLLIEVESKNWLLIAKIDAHCDNAALESALVDFWVKINEYFISNKDLIKDMSNNIYFFIWDRRGDVEEQINDKIWQLKEISDRAKVFHLSPVKDIDINGDLVDWHFDVRNKCKALKSEKAFIELDIPGIRSPYSIENVICQISESCNRPEVYDKLFIKKNLWT